jgi:LuxR family quorum-sensing system transcriptional regulator SolR
MDTWREGQFDSLIKLKNEADFFQTITTTAKELGYEYCAYGAQMPLPISRPTVVLFNNYPDNWKARYSEREYIKVDPTVTHGLKEILPVVWSEDVFKNSREFWDDARSHGLKFGWAQSARDMSGAIGLLTLARSEEPISDCDLDHDGIKLAWLSQVVHVGMTSLLMPKLIPETQARMTGREKEVLRWTAEGKTSYEIGQILNLAERTVNFHINNVLDKLRACNKIQAAVKATALGMLF